MGQKRALVQCADRRADHQSSESPKDEPRALSARKPSLGFRRRYLASARRVRDFAAENVQDKLSIACLAAECGLSRRHFIQAFAKTFNVTPHRYVLDARLQRGGALTLLW
ncbi:AraC family transcriptional regulator [Pelagibacterium sp. H642]|uniref:AraC family transcriptional regulator n=1 Tax=Pelagibacterium sp. H642 TaxID=1881069 RepID=UPI0035BED346